MYSAAWDLDDFRLYSTRPDGPEFPLAHPNAMLFAVSSQGDLALCIPTGRTQHGVIGKLARVTLSGGGPLVRAEGVSAADWSPDGSELAVVRVENERSQIEYPIGRVFTGRAPRGYMESLRVSPRGDAIAFLDHPLSDDSAGAVAMIDLDGKNYRTVSNRFNSMRGLAWSPDGGEVWFAAAKQGTNMAVWAVSRRGRERNVHRSRPTSAWKTFRATGGCCFRSTRSRNRWSTSGAVGGPKDLYWHDESQVQDISRDGETILFSESGGATRQDYDACLRQADASSPAVHLGVGLPLSLSPDGQWVIANSAGSPAPLTLLPTGPGDPRTLAADGIHHVGAAWLPDGKGFVFAGIAPGENLRYYVQSLQGGTPRPDHRRGCTLRAAKSHSGIAGRPVRGGGGRRETRGHLFDSGRTARHRARPCAQPGTGLHAAAMVPGWPSGAAPVRRAGPATLAGGPQDRQSDALEETASAKPRGLARHHADPGEPDCQSYTYSPLNVLSQVYLAAGLR